MAIGTQSGVQEHNNPYKWHAAEVGYLLIDTASEVFSGPFVDVRFMRAGVVEVYATSDFVGTLQLWGSIAKETDIDVSGTAGNPPTGAVVQVGVNITASARVTIDMPLRWLCAVVSAYTSGTSISARFLGVR